MQGSTGNRPYAARAGYIKELKMPYQNPYPEIMFVVAIWLLPILLFVIMLIGVFAARLSENRTKTNYRSMEELQTISEFTSQSKENTPVKDTEFTLPAWEQNQQGGD